MGIKGQEPVAPDAGQPWVNLAEPYVTEEAVTAVSQLLRSGWLSCGRHVERWEAGLADLLGVSHVVATSSCTLATHVALAALGVGWGDEVVIPSFTWPSLVWSVRATGATCTLADIDRFTLVLSPDTIGPALTGRTKAVLPVDYAGVPVDIGQLRAALPDHVAVIEDAAHAFGSRRNGTLIGSEADVTLFSFNPTKTLGVGELGAIATNDESLAASCRALRNYGVTSSAHEKRRSRDPSHDVVAPGPNAKPSELTCAIAAEHLRAIDSVLTARMSVYMRMRQAFAGLAVMQATGPEVDVVPYLFPLRLPTPELRDRVFTALRSGRVEAGRHYVPLHCFPGLDAHVLAPGALTSTDHVSERVVTLPAHERVSDQNIDYMVKLLRQAISDAPLHSGATTGRGREYE